MAKRKRKPSFEELCEIGNELYADLEKESDRGLVLVTADYLSSLLEALLRQVFVDDHNGEAANVLDNLFREMGPLGSFAVRTRLAYLMGLIGGDTYHALGLIRELRNEAAHSISPFSFGASDIRDKCRRLTEWEYYKQRSEEVGQTGRQQFMFTMWWVAVELMLRTGSRRHAEIGKEFYIPIDELPCDDEAGDTT